MPGTEIANHQPNNAFDPSVDPQPFAAGVTWRKQGHKAQVQRVLHAGRLAWREFAPTAVEFTVIALGIADDRPADSVLRCEISPQFWEAALGIGLPGDYALPDPSFVYAFMKGVLHEPQ